MSVTKNQRGLGFQGDVIDFFSKFDEFIVDIYVCVFVLGVNRLYDVSLTVWLLKDFNTPSNVVQLVLE